MNIAETLQTLYQQYGHLSGISIECQKDLVAIGIENQSATAEVFLQGAQITRYQPIGEQPLLFLSEACTYQQGNALRGGIPICWPWFGDLKKNNPAIQCQFSEKQINTAQAHGFVRNDHWQLDNIATPSKQLTVLEFSYQTTADNSYWPFSTRLTYRIEISEKLNAQLTVSNIGEQTFCYSSALHSYFSIQDISQISIDGFHNTPFIDAVDHWSAQQPQARITVTEEVDRIYPAAPKPILLKDDSRTIMIEPSGSASTIVWNPWIEKSQHLSQFNDDEYQKMVCIETANAVDDYIRLDPGGDHKLSVQLFLAGK